MRRFWRFVFLPWEWFYSIAAKTQPIPGGHGIGRWASHTYHGQPVHLSDGQTVTPGSTILELHLVNSRMRDITTADESPVAVETALRQEYKLLAQAAGRGDIPDFTAVFGMTLLSPLVRRFGFDVLPAPDTFQNRMIARWQRILRSVFHPTGRFRRTKRPLFIYWMSKEKLIELYAREEPTAS
jgi:hypothetical protein